MMHFKEQYRKEGNSIMVSVFFNGKFAEGIIYLPDDLTPEIITKGFNDSAVSVNEFLKSSKKDRKKFINKK